MRAYVLLKVATGREREILDTLKGIPNLEDIYFLFGEWDYILAVQASDTAALSRLVTQRIRKLPGMAQTMTLIEAPL